MAKSPKVQSLELKESGENRVWVVEDRLNGRVVFSSFSISRSQSVFRQLVSQSVIVNQFSVVRFDRATY